MQYILQCSNVWSNGSHINSFTLIKFSTNSSRSSEGSHEYTPVHISINRYTPTVDRSRETRMTTCGELQYRVKTCVARGMHFPSYNTCKVPVHEHALNTSKRSYNRTAVLVTKAKLIRVFSATSISRYLYCVHRFLCPVGRSNRRSNLAIRP